MAASQRTSIPAELRSLFPTHFRVGEITYDTRVPEGYEVREPRLDETEVGEGTAITLIDAKQVPHWVASQNAQEIALYLARLSWRRALDTRGDR